jgi:hypothetical protein
MKDRILSNAYFFLLILFYYLLTFFEQFNLFQNNLSISRVNSFDSIVLKILYGKTVFGFKKWLKICKFNNFFRKFINCAEFFYHQSFAFLYWKTVKDSLNVK